MTDGSDLLRNPILNFEPWVSSFDSLNQLFQSVFITVKDLGRVLIYAQ